MAVTVRLFAAARSAAGTASSATEPGNLASITDELTDRFPGLSAVLPQCSFLVNGTAVHGDPQGVVISDGDEVDVLPPFAGG